MLRSDGWIGHPTPEFLDTAFQLPFTRKGFVEFIEMSVAGTDEPLLARYKGRTGVLQHMPMDIEPVCGIEPLNLRQRIAFDLLLDDEVPLVTLVGKAGTGNKVCNWIRKDKGKKLYKSITQI